MCYLTTSSLIASETLILKSNELTSSPLNTYNFCTETPPLAGLFTFLYLSDERSELFLQSLLLEAQDILEAMR